MQEELDIHQKHILIGSLLSKYPELTDDELRVLEEWKQKNDNSRIFDSIIETKQADFSRMIAILEEMDAVREKYLEAIPQSVETTSWWRNWKMYAAAAVIILVFISGALWINNRKRAELAKTEEKRIPFTQDAEPGKYKAKLRLADGSIIVLDSAVNKALVEQGGTNVVNENGKLIYKATNTKKEVLYNTLFTNKGETYLMQLSDGTKVWLNSQSSIHYPVSFNSDKREVEITGEAYFEVAHDASRPFHAIVDGMDIEVLGTHYNVNGYDDEPEIKTTLLEGKVKIKRENSVMLLSSGQQVRFNKTSQQLSKISDVDVDQVVAWRFGYFQFSDDDLTTVLRQLSRWYDVDVVYQENIPERSFAGKISKQNSLSQVLATLEAFDVHFKINGKKIIVSR